MTEAIEAGWTTIWSVLAVALPTIGSLLGSAAGALIAYILGIRRARYQRRDEQRDTAIAEIYGALTRFDRDCITWSKPQEAGIDNQQDFEEWSKRVGKNLETFLDCYYTRLIWLDDGTKDMLKTYAGKGTQFYYRLWNYMDSTGTLTDDGTSAYDLLNKELEPAYGMVEDKLRKDFDIKRSWWRRIFR